MDEELREAERKWKAFYSGKPYVPQVATETVTPDGWEIVYEHKPGRLGRTDSGAYEIEERQETWGNPNAAEKAAKRYIRRMKYDSLSPIRIIHIGNYKFQPRVLPFSQEQKTRRAKS